jgi:hypothetical protein
VNDEHLAERELTRIAGGARNGLRSLGGGKKHDG